LQSTKNIVSPYAKFRLQWTVCGHMGNPAYCSVFDQTGNFLLTGADDYLIKIWDVNRGLLVRSCKGHLSYISLIAVSPDNSLFASCCVFGTIRVWRMCDGVCLKMMKHEGSINWIKFDEASCALASGGDDGQCIMWDLTKLVSLEELRSPLVQEVLKSKERQRLEATRAMEDHDSDLSQQLKNTSSSLGIFDWSCIQRLSTATTLPSANLTTSQAQTVTGILPFPHVSEEMDGLLSNTSIRVVCLDICSVAGVVVTGSDDAVARIWRFDNPAEGDHRYPARVSSKRAIDIHRSAYTSAEDYATVQRHLLLRLEGHLHPVTDVQFNSMGDRVVTGSNLDGTVRIWSLDRHYSSSVHLILDLSEQDDISGQQQSSGQPALTKTGRRGAPRTLSTNSLTP
jgi:WD40 repeat protein